MMRNNLAILPAISEYWTYVEVLHREKQHKKRVKNTLLGLRNLYERRSQTLVGAISHANFSLELTWQKEINEFSA